MGSPFHKLVDATHRGKTAATLLSLPPDALAGVSAADAAKLHDAFGVQTIADLADHKALLAAQALLHAAGQPGFDLGPPPQWATRFAAAPHAHYQNHPSGRFRLDFGPVYYRGRLDGTARVLLLGQDPAANEIAAHRILIGDSGQRVQGLLRKLGIARSYVMVNTFLYPVFGQYDAELTAISAEPPIASYRQSLLNAVIAVNPIEAIIAVGKAAREAIDAWAPPPTIHRANIMHPAALNTLAVTADWNAALADLAVLQPDPGQIANTTPYGNAFTPADHEPIPRFDLPFGIPAFIGVGSHADRDGDDVIRISANPV